jgi:hypothetical protein
MSYFSLLRPTAPGAGTYVVEQLHVNVWSLAGLLGHRPMIIDVGVLFRPDGPAPVEDLEIVIPARVVKQIDLSAQVLHSARLIFAHRYDSATDHSIALKGYGPVEIVPAATIEEARYLDLVTDQPAKDLTALRVSLAHTTHHELAYTRVRFVVDNSPSLWRWRRVLGRRSGAIVDLRVHDPREGGSGANAPAEIHGRDLPIMNLEAFFMLPERFQLSGENPQLRYTRTLEGPRWRDYLRRNATGALRREVVLVHRWSKHADADRPAVSADRPFRGYLQFERVPSLRAPSDLVLVALAVVALSYAVFSHADLRSGLVDAGNWVGNTAAAIAALLAGLSIVALLALLERLKGLGALKRKFKTFEHKWFTKIGR